MFTFISFYFGAGGSPLYLPFYVGSVAFDPHCDDSSLGLSCWHKAGVSTVLVPSCLVATEPMLVSCYRATSGCSAATVFPFPISHSTLGRTHRVVRPIIKHCSNSFRTKRISIATVIELLPCQYQRLITNASLTESSAES